ncbi:hypothetical protein B0H13DRAFT_2008649 [Mycena leptocephala]|nr:hypothetical protein B0H13DRAFT_2008649 [Mycena leptocephala]
MVSENDPTGWTCTSPSGEADCSSSASASTGTSARRAMDDSARLSARAPPLTLILRELRLGSQSICPPPDRATKLCNSSADSGRMRLLARRRRLTSAGEVNMRSGGTFSPSVRVTFARHCRRRSCSGGGVVGDSSVGLKPGERGAGSSYLSGRRKTKDGRSSGTSAGSDFWNGRTSEDSDADAW